MGIGTRLRGGEKGIPGRNSETQGVNQDGLKLTGDEEGGAKRGMGLKE